MIPLKEIKEVRKSRNVQDVVTSLEKRIDNHLLYLAKLPERDNEGKYNGKVFYLMQKTNANTNYGYTTYTFGSIVKGLDEQEYEIVRKEIVDKYTAGGYEITFKLEDIGMEERAYCIRIRN